MVCRPGSGIWSRRSRGRSGCRQAGQHAGRGKSNAVPCALRREGEGMTPVVEPFLLRQSPTRPCGPTLSTREVSSEMLGRGAHGSTVTVA